MYRSLLRIPGVRAIYLTSIVGRLPLGAIGLLFILRTREMTGSYAAGGVVAAVNALGLGIGSPLLGRLIDRRGQTGTLVFAALLGATGMAAFAALPDGAPLWAAVAAAGVSGLGMPPLSACMRAIWSDVLPAGSRHAAYALDSVVFELVYITGPLVLVGVVGAWWSLQAAALTAAALGVAGATGFAATRLSRGWRPHSERSADLWGPLRGAGVRTILGTLTLFALGVAGIEIAVAAFAQRHGSSHSVGVLLALWGLGSMVGGLVAGHRRAPADPPRRLALLMLLLAITEMPLAAAGSVPVMGALLVVAGVAIAPGLALAFQILSDVAPTGTATEAQTWVGTGFGVGIAGGSALCGWVVDVAGTGMAMLVVVAFSLASAALVGARIGTLRVEPEPVCAAPAPRPETATASA